MRENEGYRETLATLRERFGGKDSISAKELSEYVGLNYQVTQNYIKKGLLPGQFLGRRYVVTITQLAWWETQKNRR